MIAPPDYTTYTLEELYAALNNLWRTKFEIQARIKEVVKLIGEKERNND